jgi:hypothetical protein
MNGLPARKYTPAFFFCAALSANGAEAPAGSPLPAADSGRAFDSSSRLVALDDDLSSDF